MAAYLSPVFGAGAQLFNNQGVVLSGGKIYTYLAGTTTPQATWTDSTQLVANANPIILDSAGRLSNEMWLQGSSTYKFILQDSSSNVLGTWDNVAGLNDITSSVTVSEWSATNLTPSYISTTSFSVPGNNTATFAVNRRLKIAVAAGTIYGYVVSSTFSTVTTVVVQTDSIVLDSGISSVSVGLLNSTNPTVPQQYLAANAPVSLTAATTTNIGAALSANITITGTTTITAFDNVIAGILRLVYWSAATPITYNVTNMQLMGGGNRTNSAGDFSIFRSLGSGNWVEEVFQRRIGSVIQQNVQSASYTTIISDANNNINHPSTDNNPRTFTIDSNANVPYPLGTTLTFSNQINTLTIGITADTLTWVATNTTGSEAIGPNRVAQAIKVAVTSWLIYDYGSIGFVDATAGNYCAHPPMKIVTINTAMAKTHEVRVSRYGTYRTYYYLTSQAGNTSSSQIYKNGSPFGTLHQVNGTGTNYYTEDLVFSAGDLVQLYAGISNIAYNVTCNLLVLEGTPWGAAALYSLITI